MTAERDALAEAIRYAINTNSAENASNTPDYILAQFVCACLAAFNTATQQRETWHGRDARPSLAAPAQEPICHHLRQRWKLNMKEGTCIDCGAKLPQDKAAPAQSEPQDYDALVARLRATRMDRDNFPRMDSERWLPVGLAREAADAIAALRAELAHANDVLSSYRGTYTREKERAERAEAEARESNERAHAETERRMHAEAERDSLRSDAERWSTFCNLWAYYTEMTVTQDEDGRWSITGVEAVEHDLQPGKWTGDDPDAAIDASRAKVQP